MSNELETQNTALLRDLSVALAELLYVVEGSSKTKRGDYHHERANAKRVLRIAEKHVPGVLSGSELLGGQE